MGEEERRLLVAGGGGGEGTSPLEGPVTQGLWILASHMNMYVSLFCVVIKFMHLHTRA